MAYATDIGCTRSVRSERRSANSSTLEHQNSRQERNSTERKRENASNSTATGNARKEHHANSDMKQHRVPSRMVSICSLLLHCCQSAVILASKCFFFRSHLFFSSLLLFDVCQLPPLLVPLLPLLPLACMVTLPSLLSSVRRQIWLRSIHEQSWTRSASMSKSKSRHSRENRRTEIHTIFC